MSLHISQQSDAPVDPLAFAFDVHVNEHAHTAQFYADDDFLVDELARFIGTALIAGDATVIIATKAHREGLTARLQSRGLDTVKAIASDPS
jgi:hypothetical protein